MFGLNNAIERDYELLKLYNSMRDMDRMGKVFTTLVNNFKKLEVTNANRHLVNRFNRWLSGKSGRDFIKDLSIEEVFDRYEEEIKQIKEGV